MPFHTQIQTCTQTNKKTDRRTDGPTDRDRQTYRHRQTDGRTDRQTDGRHACMPQICTSMQNNVPFISEVANSVVACSVQLKVLIPCEDCEDTSLVPCRLVSTYVATCASTRACIFRSDSLRSASQSAVTRWSSLRLLSLGELRKRYRGNFGLNTMHQNLHPFFRCISFMFTLSLRNPTQLNCNLRHIFHVMDHKGLQIAPVILQAQIFWFWESVRNGPDGQT
jgi:hypothetical protein